MKTAGKTAIAAAAATTLARPAQAATRERIRHAVIGTGGMGRNHVNIFSTFDDCDVVELCDTDPRQLERALEVHAHPEGVRTGDDYRKILDDPSIDSVSIATPDHWHAPIAIAALVAGKHVYVEKPCCHNIHEGAMLVTAAERYGKCVQHGTQHRSDSGVRAAIKMLHDGQIGKVRVAKAINHQLRGPIGRAPESDPPPGVNYDRWIGPGPKRPFTKSRWHYNWHWMWDFGTGDIGNDGVHQLDVARWGLNVGLPKAVGGSGGQLFYDDDHETPDTQFVTYEYDECYLHFEMRLWTRYPLEGHDNAVVFYGDGGTIEISRKGCHITPIGEERTELSGAIGREDNARNFVDCVKADDPSGLLAPISEGAPSSMLCHLGNICTRLGRRLLFDPESHRFIDDEEANGLVTREYRAGYELPEEFRA